MPLHAAERPEINVSFKNEAVLVSHQFGIFPRYFFSLINYYREVWGIDKAVWFVGYSGGEQKREFLNRMRMGAQESVTYQFGPIGYEVHTALIDGVRLDAFFYPAGKGSVDCENHLKAADAWIGSKGVPLWADGDEFLYSTDVSGVLQRINRGRGNRFHFVEGVPDGTCLQWCKQSWPDSRFLQGRHLQDWQPCKWCKREHGTLCCSTCKTLTRSRHCHSNTLNYTGSACCLVEDNDGLLSDEMLKRGVCFHLPHIHESDRIKRPKHSFRKHKHYQSKVMSYKEAVETFGTFTSDIVRGYLDSRDEAVSRMKQAP